MIKLPLVLDSEQLFYAQAEMGAQLKSFEEFQKLTEAEQQMVLDFLRDYSKMLQSYIMQKYHHTEEKNTEAQPAVWKNQKAVAPEYGKVVPKEEALIICAKNFKKLFGRELKIN